MALNARLHNPKLMAEKLDEKALEKLLDRLKECRDICRWGAPGLIVYGIFDQLFWPVPSQPIGNWIVWAIAAWIIGEILNRVYQALRMVQLNLIGLNVSRMVLEEEIETLKTTLNEQNGFTD